jgi:hypothetical protein
VNQNLELPASDLAVSLQLSLHFNEKDQDGRAFPSCKSIGEPIGLSEATVIRSVRRLEQHGHIRVIWGQQGKGHPNQYWMIVKPSPVKVSKTPKPASAKPASVNPKPSPVQENLLKNHIGDQEVPNMCESSDLQGQIGSLAAGGSALRAAPGEDEELPFNRVEGSKQGDASAGDGGADVDAGADHEAVDGEVIPPDAPRRSESEAFAELRAVWDRGHVCDGKPKTIAADQRAFAAARRHATADAIITGALAWREAFSPPHSKLRFLPPLGDWLDQRCWATSPPDMRRRSKSGASKHNGQYRNGHHRNGHVVGFILEQYCSGPNPDGGGDQ